MKKGIWMLIIGLCSLSVALGIYNISFKEDISTPDSGYDYDYDGGSSGGYSDGYSGGSSSSSSSSESSNNHSSGNSDHYMCKGNWWNDCGGKTIVLVFGSAFIIIIAYYFFQEQIKIPFRKFDFWFQTLLFRKLEVKNALKDYKIYEPSDLEKYKLNYKQIVDKAYQIYEDVQVAWMNFDYDTLRDNLSDELYNMYRMQLEVLSLKKQQNIMKDFKKKSIYIIGLKEEHGIYTIDIALDVFQKDYIIDVDKPKKAVRGDKYKHGVLYKITYTMTKGKNKKCPNCGAKLNNKASEVCNSCGAVIVSKKHDLVMVKKEVIMQ